MFSSHFPVFIEADTIQARDVMGVVANAPASLRGCVSTVNMSLASTLAELRGMSVACEALTEEGAAWLAYIPSLIYCTMTFSALDGAVIPRTRFK